MEIIMKNAITHIVVQTGYCVFGAGDSRQAAIEDAAQWMEGSNGRQGEMTTDEVSALITKRPNYGDFTILTSDHAEFDSYIKNQGGFTKIDGEWFAD